ncbi:hypothetical protein M514_24441 [Trichuris suis]|nr:hypothetical protein M514_24441 [Trichuris suis]
MLKQGNNRAIVLEYENPGQCVDQYETVCAVEFIDFPLLSKSVLSNKQMERRLEKRKHSPGQSDKKKRKVITLDVAVPAGG